MTEIEVSQRSPLTRERVLRAAVDLADREGLDALTMRRLGAMLGVKAMSLYKHIANKDAILDGIVEAVITEIDIRNDGAAWDEAMRLRAISARQVLSRHSWAIGLLETRRLMGPAHMRYVDTILGILRSAGFSIEGAAHAFWLLDAYVYGHVIQETNLSGPSAQMDHADGVTSMGGAEQAYPHLAELTKHALGSPFSFDGEFEYGLDLILSALKPAARAQ